MRVPRGLPAEEENRIAPCASISRSHRTGFLAGAEPDARFHRPVHRAILSSPLADGIQAVRETHLADHRSGTLPGFEGQPAEPGEDGGPTTAPFGREEEQLFQATRAALHEPKAPDRKSSAQFWFVFSLALYILYGVFFAGEDAKRLPSAIALLVGSLLFHELGHIAGMRLFGYRDLRVLFIPFLGAAASGTKEAAPGWQRCIVLLLGPLSGIVLAGALQVAFRPAPDTLVHEAALVLLGLNLFNLLPLVPLDGGRILQITVFSRAPVLDAGFLLLACLGLGALSYALETPVLGILALLMGTVLPARLRQARHCSRLRSELGVLPHRVEDLSEFEERRLFCAARDVWPLIQKPAACARNLRGIHEEVLVRPPSAGATAALLLAYGGSFLVGLVLFVLVAGSPGLTGETLAAARDLAGHLERFEQESQKILGALVKLRDQPGDSAGEKTVQETMRLREDLGRMVDEMLARLENTHPLVRDFVLDGDENVLLMLATLEDMREGLRKPDPFEPRSRDEEQTGKPGP